MTQSSFWLCSPDGILHLRLLQGDNCSHNAYSLYPGAGWQFPPLICPYHQEYIPKEVPRCGLQVMHGEIKREGLAKPLSQALSQEGKGNQAKPDGNLMVCEWEGLPP